MLLSEDANFYGHEGIDWDAMQDAARHDLAQRRFARGASTITQQLAKNLWFGTEKSLWRKAKEAVLAAKLERALSKRRILALYLNVVELDDASSGSRQARGPVRHQRRRPLHRAGGGDGERPAGAAPGRPRGARPPG